MARIIFRHLSGKEEGRRQFFSQKRVVIGRDSECDVRFDLREDLEVSGQHAEVTADDESGKRWSITDLESTNGTFVNGSEIKEKTKLSSKDRIELGPGGPRLQFVVHRPWWKRLLGR